MFFKSEKGFSLAEVLVSAGLLGVLALGMNYGIEILNKQKKSSKTKIALQTDLNISLKYLAAHTNGLSWNDFDFDNTYYQGNNLKTMNLVNWNASDIDSISVREDLRQTISTTKFGNVDFFLDSFTLVKEKGGTNGLYFSRCVSASDYKTKDFTLQEALDINMRPYLVKEGEVLSIYCASSGADGKLSNSAKIIGRKDNYRVMSFYSKNNTWKQMPSLGDRAFLLGSGFMVFMNRALNPDSFVAYSFALDDPCYRYDNVKDCNRLPILALKKLTGPIQSTGIHDSGFMIIQ